MKHHTRFRIFLPLDSFPPTSDLTRHNRTRLTHKTRPEMAPGSSMSPVTLEALASLNSLESNTVYRGAITKVRRNKTVLYVDLIGHEGDPGRVAVEARGDWAQQLDQTLVRGDGVVLKGVGGRIAKATQGQKGARVIYEQEISGFYEDTSSFHFSKGEPLSFRHRGLS